MANKKGADWEEFRQLGLKDILQKFEDKAYRELTDAGYAVEMSEGYIPIEHRNYEVLRSNKVVFSGTFKEFIDFYFDTLKFKNKNKKHGKDKTNVQK